MLMCSTSFSSLNVFQKKNECYMRSSFYLSLSQTRVIRNLLVTFSNHSQNATQYQSHWLVGSFWSSNDSYHISLYYSQVVGCSIFVTVLEYVFLLVKVDARILLTFLYKHKPTIYQNLSPKHYYDDKIKGGK